MSELNSVQRELVALGAAVGSNCVPCIVNHVAEARKAGLSAEQIREAIALADAVRKVPARQVLNTAYAHLDAPLRDEDSADGTPECGCQEPQRRC